MQNYTWKESQAKEEIKKRSKRTKTGPDTTKNNPFKSNSTLATVWPSLHCTLKVVTNDKLTAAQMS